jgi:cytochrome d ubiquinol oxidase subunit I
MDKLFLSRLQFAVTAAFHFIFVPLTLGLSVLIAFMETKYLFTKDEDYLRMAKFWGKLFIINFILGVVTGITMEFQFGMNWAEYSRYVGDIFGSPLAIEATLAFFLESTFIGVWIFGWNKLPPWLHALSIWLVAIATNLSALWILIANGWMQKPVGYILNNGRAEMVDFWAVVTNPYGLLKFGHAVMSGWVVAGFFVLGVSAYHLLKKNEVQLFRKAFKIGAVFSLISSLLVVFIGHFHAHEVAQTQPTKIAAMESLWETKEDAPLYILLLPDPSHERNYFEMIKIPGLLSFLAGQKKVKGLKEFPEEDRPPVTLTFFAFRLMVGLGFLFIGLSVLATLFPKTIENSKILLMIFIGTIPLPYIAGQLGWIVAEVGRQPWIVYGLLRTSDAISRSVEFSQVITSFVGFTFLYGFLGLIDIYLLYKFSIKGPEPKGV